ncbi:MAG TPA: hypothetical protein PLT50_01875 [bacterium]|nr:hypothetical protein [bacterium]
MKKYSPIFVLIPLYILSFFSIHYFDTGYWYDEIIVTNMSTQPLQMLLDTLLAEPHPLGFYLLLRLVDVSDFVSTRTFVLTVSFLITVTSLYWAINKGIIRRYSLYFPLFLLLYSPLWISISSNIKQDSVTAPLFLFSIFVGIHSYEKKDISTLWVLLFIFLLSFFFGYINSIKILVILLGFCFYLYYKNGNSMRERRFLVPGVLALPFLLGYFLVFGYRQYLTNASRFSWLADQFQGIYSLFRGAVAGPYIKMEYWYISDLIFLCSLFMVFMYIYNIKASRYVFKLFFPFILLCFFYFWRGVSRDRYCIELFILYFLMWGKVLNDVYCACTTNFRKMLFFSGLVLYGCVGFCTFLGANKSFYNYRLQNEYISQLLSTGLTGLVDRHPNESYIRKIGYFRNNTHIIPINLNFPLPESTEITRDLLKMDGVYQRKELEDYRITIRSLNIYQFLYIMGDTSYPGVVPQYFDPDLEELKFLNHYCESNTFHFDFSKYFILFYGCNFE